MWKVPDHYFQCTVGQVYVKGPWPLFPMCLGAGWCERSLTTISIYMYHAANRADIMPMACNGSHKKRITVKLFQWPTMKHTLMLMFTRWMQARSQSKAAEVQFCSRYYLKRNALLYIEVSSREKTHIFLSQKEYYQLPLIFLKYYFHLVLQSLYVYINSIKFSPFMLTVTYF